MDALVLDTATTLRPNDVPPDTVDSALAGLNGGYLVRAIVIDDLRAMARAAPRRRRRASHGRPIAPMPNRCRRSRIGWRRWDEALGRSARPGHSGTELGTTIDFTSRGAPWTGKDWAQTDAGAWLLRHLAVRLRPLVSTGRARRVVLRLRALALPLRGTQRGLRDSRLGSGASGVAASLIRPCTGRGAPRGRATHRA